MLPLLLLLLLMLPMLPMLLVLGGRRDVIVVTNQRWVQPHTFQ
jgi:hypothetical protein